MQILRFFFKKGGLKPDELGAITVFDRYAYVAVKRNRVRELLSLVAGEKIKGLKTVVEPVRR
ncbi:MAG: DbpA RNA binding domain-containing protein [Bacteroidaceae bacterium]|nr:DbpA RNA binding domain-containing protein [Bacteroidaceae bacterium]